MFKDTKKELQRLEAELMAEEEELEEEEAWDEEEDLLDDDDDFGEETPEVYRNFSNRYKAYNADRTDWDPEDLAEELERRPRRGLAIFILLLLAGVIAAIAWWYFGGSL